MKKESIKLTGTTLPLIVFYIDESSNDITFDQLAEKVNQYPQFFNHSPLVIDLANISSKQIRIDINDLVAHCRSLSLQPIAFRNVHESLVEQAKGLPMLTSARKENAVESQTKTSDNTQIDSTEFGKSRSSKIITRPIRSGQQVYAEGCDLIVLAQVSEGSEVLADGNIHIYGSLRGRALAGVNGDTQARIFCQKMHAELIAIAGHFLLCDSIDGSLINQAVHISLDDEHLNIKSFST